MRLLGYLHRKRFGLKIASAPPSNWLKLFSSQTFSCINTPTSSSWLFFLPTLPTKMEQTKCSETSAHKIQKPGNHPDDRIQHSEQGKSLKSRKMLCCFNFLLNRTSHTEGMKLYKRTNFFSPFKYEFWH